MTKRETLQKMAGFLTTDVPKATAVASFLVAEPIKVEPIAEKVRKPPTIGYRVVAPDPAKGQTFTPYVVVTMANHAYGKLHKTYNLDQLWLDTLKGFVTVHGWTIPPIPR